ncbi:C2 family cysteine protease [Alkalinema sp. FACHB-956]|uniref:C2 family cysteine protease n=1 Tax=Alkalinema sp. FACHB-956 TaxID=2692768 RepID=UPI00168926C5|nr:C2 family cysteine protease [Alkalinema sp. FACHB-956]MBD2325782.1 hypothetical protein [Alkalinema sp. FACHB-956]
MDTLMRSSNPLNATTPLQASPITALSPSDLSAISTFKSNAASSLLDVGQGTVLKYDRYGDTFAQAGTPLASTMGNRQWQMSDAVGGVDPIDMLKFNVPLYHMGGADIHISLSGDANIHLFRDANGNQQIEEDEILGRAWARNNTIDATLDFSGMYMGEYYLEIRNTSPISRDYKLKVSYEQFNDVLSREMNFTGATIASGTVNNSNSSDSYHFTLDQPQNFHLSLTSASNTTDFRLVRDGNNNGRLDEGEVVADYYYQGQTNQPITLMHRQLGEGSYFLQVNQSQMYSSESNYQIMMGCDWFSNSITDDAILTTARAAYIGDGVISHTEMRDILRQAQDAFIVDATELGDLQKIVNQGSNLGISKSTQVLANKVLNWNLANDKSNLGGFGAGSSAAHLEQLIEKWFLGTDRPGIPRTIDSVTLSTENGVLLPVYHQAPIAYQKAEGSLFQNGISYFDIDQGAVGDCYFLASLGAVALHAPNRIADMFTDNADGTFTVRFFVDGQENYVTVDRYLPTYEANGKFVYANDASGLGYWDDRNELWVALAEKAYAQLNQESFNLPALGLLGISQDGSNTYEGISGGWAFNALTHITGLNAMPHQDLSSGALFWASNTIAEMMTAFNQGRMVVVNTTRPDNADVVGKHAYILAGYDANTGYFSLYNPWHSNPESANNPTGQYPIVYKTASQLLEDFHSWDATVTA